MVVGRGSSARLPNPVPTMARFRPSRQYLALLGAVMVVSYFGTQLFGDSLVLEYGIIAGAILVSAYLSTRRRRNQR